MTVRRNTSYILGAAFILASTTSLLTGPVHAGLKVDYQVPGLALVEKNEHVIAHDSFRVSSNAKKHRQQTSSTPSSLQSGSTPQPQPASAGEEVKKVLKKNFDKYCGKPNSIC